MRALLLLALLATPALAQQQPDMATMQRAIAVLQQQRNNAMDALASAEVQRAALAEELAALKAKIAEQAKQQAQPEQK